MIAYVDEINKTGLAIALEDEPNQPDWNDAKTAISGLAPVSHGTWKMPTIDEWKQMFTGCGDTETQYDTWTHNKIDAKLTAAEGTPLSASLPEAEYGYGYWSDDVVTYSEVDYIEMVNVKSEYAAFESNSFVTSPFNPSSYYTRACLSTS